LHAFCGAGVDGEDHPVIGVIWTGDTRAAIRLPSLGQTSTTVRRLMQHIDAAAGGLVYWSEFDTEAERLSIEVRGLSHEDLRVLIAGSTREISTTEHRRLHQEASDFVRWGRRGGRRTLALYGRAYFSLLARLRWGRALLEALTRHRVGV
jgi:hypothetical protein